MNDLTLTPLSPRFGVQVHGVDLTTLTPDHLYPQVRAAFEEHSALLFKGQDLGPAEHMALARLFGPIEDREVDERKPGEAFEVPEVSNIREDGTVTAEADLHTLNLKANMQWHADSTFLPVPALANILTAKVVTSSGGATELACTRAAFADMTPDRQALLRRLRLRHHLSHSRRRLSPELAKLPMFHKWPETSWPAVWRNPVNGCEAVYVASHAFAVEGMDADAGAALIDTLLEDCGAPDYVYAHSWEVGDVLIWDQRAVLHRATPWPYEEPRRLTSLCVSATEADGLGAMLPPA